MGQFNHTRSLWTMFNLRTRVRAAFTFFFIIIFVTIQSSSSAKTRTDSLDTFLETANKFSPISSTDNPIANSTDKYKAGFLQIIEGIYLGLELAVKECQHQFQWERWNCPISPVTSIISRTSHNEANREVAYMQAISAAGIMYYVTKRCHRGVDGESGSICGCHRYSLDDNGFYPGIVQWKWKGCSSQNVKFGEKVSRMFLKPKSSIRNTLQALKRHNERVGNKAVLDTMRIVCKCHGPTGSCVTRTCWKQLQSFRDIGRLLKKKYRRAKDLRNAQGLRRNSNKVRRTRFSRVSKKGLVYIADSPNYCEADNSIGFLGTHGRECKRKNKEINGTVSGRSRNSCKRLCRDCGLKIRRVVTEEASDCCKFKWCCKVECKPCFKHVTKYFCKHGRSLNRRPPFIPPVK